MTREESVSILKMLIPKDSRGNGKVKTNIAITEAILNAVEALEQEPKTDSDCISREEAIKCLECDFDITGRANMEVVVNYINSAHDKIMNLPSVEQEPSYNSINLLVESKLKNPKAKTFDILHFIADNAGLSTFEAIEKAYNMGVSEQEQVLDKIRAEIADLDDADYDYEGYYKAVTDALQVIDKYRQEG